MQFDQIRPFDDNDVKDVLARLLADNDFLSVLTLVKASEGLTFDSQGELQQAIKDEFSQTETIDQFQAAIEAYVKVMVDKTTSAFSFSGLENLDPKQGYLFISNHRDITLDPAFVNYALYINQIKTANVAIGDNLLTKQFISDLMRLNKSFIVQRSATGFKKMYKAYLNTSNFIKQSIAKNESIWIAQSEGRAKDGVDITDPAIIKMFYLSHKKEEHFAQAIKRLKLVPVAISYEYDPCDQVKAIELAHTKNYGQYIKKDHEDLASIVTGISGFKGRVHVAFGRVLEQDYAHPEAVAAAIDLQVRQLYKLYPSHHAARQILDNESGDDADVNHAKHKLHQRCHDLNPEERLQLLQAYANPVIQAQG